MVGNDFVPSLPFLKIRSGGLDLLIKIYNKIRPMMKDYLVLFDPIHNQEPTLHTEFFKHIILELSHIESKEMHKQYMQCQNEKNGFTNSRRLLNEKDMSPFQLYQSRFEHLSFFHPDHPCHDIYAPLLDKIDYSLPKHIWKAQYYQYFFQLDANYSPDYNRNRTLIVHNYLESLVFTLKYYLQECPSFDWYYQFRMPPIPSDIYTVLEKHHFDINSISFNIVSPFTPFEQLLFVLPPQMSFILPKPLQSIMQNSSYYPKEFDIDALAGGKYIYSEAILPELDIYVLRDFINTHSSFLSKDEINRNTNIAKLIVTKSIKK
jgi:5'-3' exonuclease